MKPEYLWIPTGIGSFIFIVGFFDALYEGVDVSNGLQMSLGVVVIYGSWWLYSWEPAGCSVCGSNEVTQLGHGGSRCREHEGS